MLRGVVEEVGQEADEARAVGLEDGQAGRDVGLERDAGALDRARVLTCDVVDELAERDGRAAQRGRGLLEDRQLEQVRDEVGGARRLPAGVGEGALRLGGPALRAEPLGLLEAGRERGERRPQVVADVGDEVAAQAVRRPEAVQRRLDAGGHVVDAGREAAHLVCARIREAARKVARAEALDAPRHAPDRPHEARGDHGAERERDERGEKGGDERGRPEGLPCVLEFLGERPVQRPHEERARGQAVGREQRRERPRAVRPGRDDGDARRVQHGERLGGHGRDGAARAERVHDGPVGVEDSERVREAGGQVLPQAGRQRQPAEDVGRGARLDLLGRGVEAQLDGAADEALGPRARERRAEAHGHERRRHLHADEDAGDAPEDGASGHEERGKGHGEPEGAPQASR